MLISLLRLAHRVGFRRGGRARAGRGVRCVACAALLLLLASAPSASAAAAAPDAKRIVFAARGDLWLYTQATGTLRRLTADGPEQSDSAPAFVGANAVAFVRDGDLMRMELSSRKARLVARGPVLAYAWDTPSDRLAMLVQPRGVGGHVLYLYRPRRQERVLLRRFSVAPTGSGDGDVRPPDNERSLAWSASGVLLLVDTDLARRERPIHVLDVRGRDLIPPLVGTHAGWVGGSIYYRALASARWYLRSLRGRETSRLAIRQGRMNPSLSPDRRFLALDDGRAWIPGRARRGCTCTVFVYDFRRRLERRLRRGLVAPVWLSSRTIAATDVRGCSGSECGIDALMWVPVGSGSLVGLDGDATTVRGLATLDAAVDLSRRS